MSVSDMWRLGHPWAVLYPYLIDRPWLSMLPARALMGTDLSLLYAAPEAIRRLPEGASVLDVPCGSGVALRGLRRGRGLRYHAVDIAPAMLDRTATEAARLGVADQVRTVEADVAALPLADGVIDLAMSLTGLHCVPDPEAAVGEIARVTRAGGSLVASWLQTDAAPRYRHVLAIGRMTGVCGPSASTAEVTSWLEAGGFADVDLRVSGALAYLTATKS